MGSEGCQVGSEDGRWIVRGVRWVVRGVRWVVRMVFGKGAVTSG